MHEVRAIHDLLTQIKHGEILLPEFQRGYVWNRDQVRGLLPVADRAADLFGDAGAGAAAEWIEADPAGGLQRSLFPEWDGARPAGGRRRRKAGILDGEAELQALDATTLDRVHAAMLLQANGHAAALRALLKAERERGPGFLRLANALTALYPRASREKRLLDAMLLAAPRNLGGG